MGILFFLSFQYRRVSVLHYHLYSFHSTYELLYRRGFIDPEKEAPCLKDSLKLAKKIPDFKNKKSEIKQSMTKLNVNVVFTPKAHCELAGRGIEYVWGIAKVDFRMKNAELSAEERTTSLNTRVLDEVEEDRLEKEFA